MHFLNPGYLWALLALVVPVIVHLFNLQRTEKVIFANTQMLEVLVRQTTKARNLRHLLLLITRMLAMACIILAFAQPAAEDSGLTANSGISAINIYLDNSPSMAIQENDGNALERAIAFASSLPDRFDNKGWFRLNDNSIGTGRGWTSASGIRDQILGIQKNPASKTLKTVLEQVNHQFIQQSAEYGKHLFILSDFQKDFLTDFSVGNFDTTVIHHFVHLEHDDVPNIWIDTAWTNTESTENQAKTEVFFRIRSSGLKQNKPCRIQLFEGNSLQAGISTEVKPGINGISKLNISRTGNNRRFLRLEIEDASFPSDNSFFLLIKAQKPLSVLCLSESDNPVLKKLFESSSSFRSKAGNFQNPDYTSLEQCDLLVLDKPSEISESLKDRILNHLEIGKSVCLIPSPKSVNGISLNGILNTEFSLSPLAASTNLKEKILQPGPENSFFQNAFRDPGRNPALPEVKPFLEITNRAYPLLRLESGKTFLGRLPTESGNFFLFSGDPADISLSFHRHPLMLATFFRMASVSRKTNSVQLFEQRSQERIYLRTDSGFVQGEGQIEFRNGREKVLAGLGNSGKDYFASADFSQLREGFWEVFQNGKLIDAFAINRPSGESQMEFISADALRNMLPSRNWIKFEEISNSAGHEHLKAGNNAGKELWKILLIIGVLLLVAEGFLLKKTPKSTLSS